MTPFYRAEYPRIEPEQIAADFGCTLEQARDQLARLYAMSVWRNDEFEVAIDDAFEQPADCPPLLHLSIKRLDREAVHDWRKLQQIKNMLTDPEFEAIELYPAESRLLDTANQYHLWVFADAGFRLPFGFEGRNVTNHPGGKAKQRPSPDFA